MKTYMLTIVERTGFVTLEIHHLFSSYEENLYTLFRNWLIQHNWYDYENIIKEFRENNGHFSNYFLIIEQTELAININITDLERRNIK